MRTIYKEFCFLAKTSFRLSSGVLKVLEMECEGALIAFKGLSIPSLVSGMQYFTAKLGQILEKYSALFCRVPSVL